MRKIWVVFILVFFVASLSAQSNWFEAQKAEAVVKSVTATSELVEGQYDGRYLYPPINVLDGDFDTTWCEAQRDGPGIGESITIEFEGPVSFDELRIVNGFVSGNDYYTKNNRVKSFQLTQVANSHFQQKDYILKDKTPDWQSIHFELLQTAKTLTIKITDVYKGSRYDDTCLSEVQLLYKGKVIPFINVAKIKTEQEENSKLMLKSTEAEFKKQFFSLYKKKNKKYSLYLIGPNPQDSLILYASGDTAEYFQISTIKHVKIFKSVPKNKLKAFLQTLKENYSIENDDFENDTWTSTYVHADFDWLHLDSTEDYYGDRSSYELGNCRIIKTASIDYVEVKTVMLVKIENNKVYLNGVCYTVADPDRVLYTYFNF